MMLLHVKTVARVTEFLTGMSEEEEERKTFWLFVKSPTWFSI